MSGRVGIELPTIEVRYENLTVQANCYVGNRGLPTLLNETRNMIEVSNIFSLPVFLRWVLCSRDKPH